ncbi:hypothetical protein IIB34_02645 [PVC group bacterium]|nr:hypothetical protein [PVC group bacterium]
MMKKRLNIRLGEPPLWQKLCLMGLICFVCGIPAQMQAEEAQEIDQELIQDMTLSEKMEMKISLDYKDVDILNVIRSLVWTYDLNIVTNAGVKGRVNLTLKNVTIEKALDAIVGSNDLSYRIRDDIIYVRDGDEDEDDELVSEVVFLNYISAGAAYQSLRRVISDKGDMQINELANSLIVTDSQKYLDRVKNLLEKIDIAPKQVLIEAKIVDITSTALDAFGATWNIEYSPGHGIFGRRATTAEKINFGVSMPEQSSSLTGGQVKLNELSLSWLTVSATLDALVKKGKAKILAAPSITVLNGQEARIIIGERFPFKERTQTATGTTETTKFVDIGTTLRVTPQINNDGYITMKIHPEVSSLAESLDAGPRVTTREADTIVRVKDGETFVLGGLIKHTDDQSVEKIPFFGDLPVIGHLFSRREKNQEQKELSVFITPTILLTPEQRARQDDIAREKTESYVNISKISELQIVEETLRKADLLNNGKGVESAQKGELFRKEQALNLYLNVYYEYPDSARAPEALYKAALIKYKFSNDFKGAKHYLSLLISDYPDSVFSDEAKKAFLDIDKKGRALDQKASLRKKALSHLNEGKKYYFNDQFELAIMEFHLLLDMERNVRREYKREAKKYLRKSHSQKKKFLSGNKIREMLAEDIRREDAKVEFPLYKAEERSSNEKAVDYIRVGKEYYHRGFYGSAVLEFTKVIVIREIIDPFYIKEARRLIDECEIKIKKSSQIPRMIKKDKKTVEKPIIQLTSI